MALIGTNVVDKIVPFNEGDSYPTHEDVYGQGGYVTVPLDNSTAFSDLDLGSYIPLDRRKIGQIVNINRILPPLNKTYVFTSLQNPLSSYSFKPALPYEYVGSYLSTSFVARTSSYDDRNDIDSFVGYSLNGQTWTTEPFRYCSILGGANNKFIKGYWEFYRGVNIGTTIVGGSANNVQAANFSIIGGGLKNILFNSLNVIVGGRENNNISEEGGSIVGGIQNSIGTYGSYSSIVGGSLNSIAQGNARGAYSIVGGGLSNTLAGDYSFIGGGRSNSSTGLYNFLGGGRNNNAAGGGDVVIGGVGNTTSSTNISDLTLLTVSYSGLNIKDNFVKDTKVRYINGNVYEFIPGAQHLTTPGAGVVRILPFNDSIEGFTNPRNPILTINSPSPTVDGRFGHTFYYCSDYQSVSGHFLISEPGANKVHLYRVDFSNPSRVSLITTIQPPETIPSNSLFGLSFAYMDRVGINEVYYQPPITDSINLLAIGAPGTDKVYVYKNDSRLFNYGPNSTVFTFISALTGQPSSEFGFTVRAAASRRLVNIQGSTIFSHPSSICIAVGAPNYNRVLTSPAGRTGAICVYVTQPTSDYSTSNRKFKPFYNCVNIDRRDTRDINDNFFNFISPGDRFGEKIGGISIDSLSPTDGTSLSSVGFRIYANIPTATVRRAYSFGSLPNQIGFESRKLNYYLFSRNLNVWTTANTPFTGAIVDNLVGGGIGYGFMIAATLSGYNDGPWYGGNYGDFNLQIQNGSSDLKFLYEGPNGDINGIYSINSILSATNENLFGGVEDFEYVSNTEYYGSVKDWPYKILCYNPNTINNVTGSRYPGLIYTRISDARGIVNYFAPYPDPSKVPTENISVYGFQNLRTVTASDKTGFSTIYYLSGNTLTYTNFAADVPGEGDSSNIILGGTGNTMRGKTSIIGGGSNNTIDNNITKSAILAGGSNSINSNESGLLTRSYNLIGTGENNIINDSEFSNILNGNNNLIKRDCLHVGILGGTGNTVLSGLSGVFVLGSSLSGTKSFTTYVNNLFASDHIQAKTKSFIIKHPTKPGMTLTYGSLESPYHGIRLTGKGNVINNVCVVKLPDYIDKLIKQDFVNIQLTNYKHDKVLYVDNINIKDNTFTVKTNSILGKIFNYEFFWTFTAVRSDVPEIQVES